MLNYKIILGGIAAVLSLVGYPPYLRDLFKGRTHPHTFSWFVWSVIMFVAFFAQISKGAGAGAWTTFAEGLACILIFGLSFSRGEKNVVMSDWVGLSGAIVGIVLWIVTQNPLWAVIFVTLADGFGFFPTFRKAYAKPHEETVILYFFVSLSFILALFALQTYSVTTALYPAYLAAANGVFWLYTLIRRSQLRYA